MSKFTVESVENGKAKCEAETGGFVYLESSCLPDGVKSGDILSFNGEKYEILKEETQNKKKKMIDLQSRLFSKKK